MDWLNSILLLTPQDKLEDPAVANVKGDKKTPFAVSNWVAYLNSKANIVNAGHKDHIYAGKHQYFTPAGINPTCLYLLLDMELRSASFIDGQQERRRLAPPHRLLCKFNALQDMWFPCLSKVLGALPYTQEAFSRN